MKFKLDEDLGKRGMAILTQAGHDASTVAQQKMTSFKDKDLLKACSNEGRALVTLDQGFSNPFHHRPEKSAGIAVVRADARTSISVIEACLNSLVKALESASIEGKLWIVEAANVREYKPEI